MSSRERKPDWLEAPESEPELPLSVVALMLHPPRTMEPRSATVVAAAHFFPTFWTNAAIDAALGAADSGFSAAGASAYLTGIGITALFAVAIAAVGLALARNRQQGR
mgnify:CR=1 FL=1